MSFQPNNYWLVSEAKLFFYGKITVVNSFTRNLNVKQLLFCRIDYICAMIKMPAYKMHSHLFHATNTHTHTQNYMTRGIMS